MKNIKLSNNNVTLQRVSKNTARKLFNDGETLRICMHKADPVNDFYGFYADITKNINGDEFDIMCNSYTFYNACYELGYYMAFYKFI